MKPLVNLSSSPFRNRRLFWLAILLLFIIPSYFGMQALETSNEYEGQISELRYRVGKLENNVKKTEKPAGVKVSILPEENRQLSAASELIARRTFSWSRLLDDIERNIPAGVRVLRIAVAQIQPQEREENSDGNENAATLAMTVIGKNGQEVTTMVNKFHESGRFKVFPIGRKAVEGTDDVEFELKVDYFPPNSPALRSNLNTQIASKQPMEKK